jgi:DNA-binding NarL/FixJ family response regulator
MLIKRAIDQVTDAREFVTLSPSEREVLCMIGLGKSNKEIATARGRSAETIKRQVASLFKKLGVENRTSAVAIARERGFL